MCFAAPGDVGRDRRCARLDVVAGGDPLRSWSGAGPVMLLRALAGAISLCAVTACGQQSVQTFAIVSGSENRTLEPIVQEFCKAQSVACTFEYMGSVDIGMAVGDNRGTFDA